LKIKSRGEIKIKAHKLPPPHHHKTPKSKIALGINDYIKKDFLLYSEYISY
jgi:hypothetical protein